MPTDSEYYWPTMKPSELVTCLNQCQLSVTEKNITRPDKDTLMEVYTTLCLLISGESLDDFESPCIEAIEAAGITQMNLYQEGMCELSIYNSIKKLMKAAAIPSFSIQSDVLEPNGTRTVFNLSGLINFAKFREHRLAFYSDLSQESEALLAEKEKQLEYQEQLKERLQQLKEEAAKNRPVLQQLAEQKTALLGQITELERKQSQLREESSRMKTQNQEYNERIQSIHTIKENTQQQTSRLRNGILDEPEQAVELITSLREKIALEQKQKSSIERKNLHLRTKHEQLTKLRRELEKCIELLEKCKEEWHNSKTRNKENKNLQFAINDTKQRYQDVKKKMELDEKKQTLAVQRLDQSAEKYAEKITQLNKELSELSKSYELAVKRVNTELHHEIEHHRSAAQELEDELQTLSQSHHLFMSSLDDQMARLRDALDNLYNELAPRMVDPFSQS